MTESGPHLPVFRSLAQERILATLFERAGIELTIGELARATGIPQPTVSKEVARLVPSRVVLTRTIGRARLVTANWKLSWAEHLAAILAQTVGARSRIAVALSAVNGIESAFLFGSWAARHLGHDGPPPRDVDLLVVGGAEWLPLHEALKPVEAEIGLEIDITIVSPARWAQRDSDPFLCTVAEHPLVELDLRPDDG